jgi:lysophospholipase L1-like esterase
VDARREFPTVIHILFLASLSSVVQPDALDRVAAKLRDTATVRVLHIGDSHVQGAFLGGELRRLFQESRGDAGRGLVFPHRLAGTNGAFDISWSGTGPWAASAAVRHDPQMPWGIAGWALASPGSDREIELAPSPKAPPGRLVSTRALLFGDGVRLEALIPSDSCGRSCLSYRFAERDSFRLHFEGPPARLDGIVLENGKPGVVWSEAGVNGLSFQDLLKPSRMWEEMHAWNPDLVVVSLGTNDAFQKGFSGQGFSDAVRESVRRIRLAAPGADILLTFPPDHALKAKRRRWEDNPRLDMVIRRMAELCESENVAGIDLRELMGGRGSWTTWSARGLMAKDHVHYQAEGYRRQADLLYQAIQEAVQQPFRHPVALPGAAPAETAQFLSEQDSLVRAQAWAPLRALSPKPSRKSRHVRHPHGSRRSN